MQMTQRILTGLLALMGGVAMAFPACSPSSKPVFSCTTAKGKLIEVCDSGKTIDYAFGKSTDKPEIVVKAQRKEASTTQWQGMGRTIFYTVDVPNGKTTYRVFWNFERPIEGDEAEPLPEAGVEVIVGGKSLATVSCDPKKPINQAIEGINLRPTPED